MTTQQRLEKIHLAIRRGSLAVKEGQKNWFCYFLYIQELIWERNMVDGANIDVHYQGRHIGSIHLDYNMHKVLIENHVDKTEVEQEEAA